ncbi:regulator of telomere elongation helicase 1 homolog isoform X3 [Cryptotermes secundus]|uniref:regulator of telomere elongation helicase 1 homolog isoform X3 n=1 Tax=Cryptotermes secundus TaxID=105785 RepID=UPI001454C753|nr:regulator of telomere elongation helicase 1 homolog isoform X3 [Cryptotermes secundus]
MQVPAMPEYMINGIPVNFPFEPYSVQSAYMEKVLECLKKRESGMLESPTGTGKTLSLLCASLSWLSLRKAQQQAESLVVHRLPDGDFVTGLQNSLVEAAGPLNMPRAGTSSWESGGTQIIYASRTHSQLSQAIQELKKTGYTHTKMAVLGSRDQMCIHPEVSKEENNIAKMHKCQAYTKSHACYFYSNLERKKTDPALRDVGILDIEDLVKLGQKQRVCPYFLARDLRKDADVIFMPYNYILDQKHLKSHGVELTNNVVILDEAHNVEKICEESVSICIRSTDVALCIQEITQVTYEKSHLLLDLLVKIVQYLSVTGNSPFRYKGAAIQKFVELLKIVFRASNERTVHIGQLKRCFKVHVTDEEPKKSKLKSDSWGGAKTSASIVKERVITYLCFSPAFGMKQLLENDPHCVILTSGTLSPLSSLMSELGIPIPVTLENPHVIGSGQVFVSVISTGPDGFALNSSYNTRNDPQYISSLGMTVLNVCRIVPHGILVFFPSYPVLYKCRDEWQQSGLWSKVAAHKPIFVEPRSRDGFHSTISEYYNKVQDPATRGACFMAVTRGKVSEGLDFMDVNGRAVIVTGLPYPPLMDTYVKLKRSYLRENQGKNGTQCLTADEWYLLEATRAVNQAIGRVIRHKDDYGAILLCDQRFQGLSFKAALSSWVRPHMKMHNSFGLMIRELKQFFVNAEKTLPPPRVKAPSCELKAPPVAASFDMTAKRSSTVSRTGNAAPQVSSSSSTSEWSPDDYLATAASSLPAEKKTDLFEALEKPTTVINLNDTSAVSCGKSLFKWGDSELPRAKKMKLKVAPPKVIVSSFQDSVDLSAGEGGRAKSNPSHSTSKPGSSKDKAPVSSAPKVQEIGSYLMEVKKSLDTVTYQRFSKLTRAYDKEKDFAALLTALWEVMMGDGRNLRHLFKGYRRFLRASHKTKFDAYCATMIPE